MCAVVNQCFPVGSVDVGIFYLLGVGYRYRTVRTRQPAKKGIIVQTTRRENMTNNKESFYCHSGYKDLDDPTIANIVEQTERAVENMKSNPSYITDEASLNHEKGLGSDVAGVQQVDSLVSNYNEENASSADIDNQEEELPIRTHYVSKSPDTILRQPAIQRKIEEDSIRDIIAAQGVGRLEDTDDENGANDARSNAEDFINSLFDQHREDKEVSRVI